MIKLNTLKNTDTIVGQLYVNGKATDEVMAVQFGVAVGLNCNRHWKDVYYAGHEFSINPIEIELRGIVTETKVNVTLVANKNI